MKLKWSRYRPGVAQRVSRGITLLFHDRGTGSGWVVSSTARPHFTPGKYTVPILQEAGWAPGPAWTGGKSRPHRNSTPDRRYTDWATGPTRNMHMPTKITNIFTTNLIISRDILRSSFQHEMNDGFVWRTNAGILYTWLLTCGFRNTWGIYWVAEEFSFTVFCGVKSSYRNGHRQALETRWMLESFQDWPNTP